MYISYDIFSLVLNTVIGVRRMLHYVSGDTSQCKSVDDDPAVVVSESGITSISESDSGSDNELPEKYMKYCEDSLKKNINDCVAILCRFKSFGFKFP